MKSLFIIGCPRSGTTYLLRLLASNQEFAWITNELNNNPKEYNLSSRLNKYSGSFWRKKRYLNHGQGSGKYPFSVEPWKFWNTHFEYFQWNKGFSDVPVNALPEHNSPKVIQDVRNGVEEILKHSGRHAFLSKYTDFPRVKLLLEAFPEAKFIHLVRDGRAVANSYYKKIKSGEFNTSKEESNWVSAWPKDWQEEYQSIDNKLLAFTLYQWKFFVDQIIEELKEVEQERVLEVRYSDLVSGTRKTVERIMDFIDLPIDKSMDFFIDHLPGHDMNYKWKEKLSEDEKSLYNFILREERFIQFLDN